MNLPQVREELDNSQMEMFSLGTSNSPSLECRLIDSFGSQPWAAEYDSTGNLLWAARYPENVQSYRMVRANWTGAPRTEPSIYVSTSSENSTAQTYISWNGDSRVSQWRVYASQDNTTSSEPMIFPKAGFETMYEFQLDWPQEADMIHIWAEGVSGDEVVGTTRQVMVQKDGQGGSVSDQSGVGSGEISNEAPQPGPDAQDQDNDNGASALVVSEMLLGVVGLTSLLVAG
jgi:hypothetical protein